ncbi:MAG: RNA polymerase sigma factor RpoH [Alphaproteobacteria bacterium MarineAlpha5_Bin8]|nr:MAG: RNA polymerase sigma factor RpoH [Alphaproteobacteria bacterium MarineAlpha5_Bin7]PPR48185.1 MAG: RNA polymerase sigma factor RpoH [Alphaproteobacteria bacterium MarineAlpha5_Bin8]PPR54610.1 MAG: RNA polymerase sigma factor RpoH [Alphaproteobacteria bacterium MarineAlpha5_Bin6]|tara:strand:- start:833 stop:1657 length:825 start_codon:yes stop_codon:yes gene_type:complete
MNNESLLKKNEENELIKNWQVNKDKKSLNRILGAYKRLVNSIVKKYLSYGIPKEDLMHEGLMGIIIALRKYDIAKGYRLSTYARWWIRASIQNYIIKNWSIVKNSSTASYRALFFNLNKLKKLINYQSFDYMGENELKEISKILKLKSLEVQNMESRLTMGDQSLNQTIDDENNTDLLSMLKDDSPTQDKIFEKKNDDKLKNVWLTMALDHLKDRERIIIQSRKLEEKAKTFEELGKKLQISKERVRQIEVQALKKLKNNILEISKQPKNFFIS